MNITKLLETFLNDDKTVEKIFDDVYCEKMNKKILSLGNEDDLYNSLCKIALTYIKPFDDETYKEFLELITNEHYYKEIKRNNIYLIRDFYFWVHFAQKNL